MTEDDLRERLRDLRVDPPDAGFAMSLHRKLAAAGPPDPLPFWRRLWPSGTPWAVGPAIGAAAALAIFFVISRGHEAPVAAFVPASKVAVVRVNLSTQVAVADAQIRVSLPEGLVFWADGEELAQRAFEWTQPLRAGDNDIPIAVRGVRPGRYRMTVTAQIGGQQVDDEVVLEVTGG